VLKTLFGMLLPRSGEVRFEGKRINGKPPRALLGDPDLNRLFLGGAGQHSAAAAAMG